MTTVGTSSQRKLPWLDRAVGSVALGAGLFVNVLVSASVFVYVWVYAYQHFGLWLGGGLGWIPATILALMTYLLGLVLAPLIGVAAIGLVGYALYRTVVLWLS